MASVVFYNYFKNNFESTLTNVITKIYKTDKSIVVRTTTIENLSYLDSLLWTFNLTSFIPHDRSGETISLETPVYLTTGKEVPNNAEILILVNGAKFSLKELDSFTKVVVIFCKNDPDSINQARDIWQKLKLREVEKQYWVQNESGWMSRNNN